MNVKEKELNFPPEAKGETFIGSARDFADDTLGFIEKNIPIHGSIFQLKSIFFRFISHFDRVVVVSDPEMVKHILQTNNKNYVKSYGYRILKVLLGEGLLTSEGEFWRKQRRLL
jgi:cytochrome P450